MQHFCFSYQSDAADILDAHSPRSMGNSSSNSDIFSSTRVEGPYQVMSTSIASVASYSSFYGHDRQQSTTTAWERLSQTIASILSASIAGRGRGRSGSRLFGDHEYISVDREEEASLIV